MGVLCKKKKEIKEKMKNNEMMEEDGRETFFKNILK